MMESVESQIDFDVNAFRAWLLAHWGEGVGIACNDHLCPVALWSSLRLGRPCSLTWDLMYVEGSGFSGEVLQVPEWVKRFTLALERYSMGGHAVISGAVALSLLDQLFPDVPAAV